LASTSAAAVKSTSIATERLHVELQACWETLADLTTRLAQSTSSLRNAERCRGSLQQIRETYSASAAALLEPVEACLRLKPVRRSLEAVQEWIRQGPAKIPIGQRRLHAQLRALLVETTLDLCEPWRIWINQGYEQDWLAWDK